MKKSIHPVKYFIGLIRKRELTKDHQRDFRVLIIATILNFSFALEKFFIVIKHPISDTTWMFVYGILGLIVGYLAIHDYIYDLHEDHIIDREHIDS